MRLNRNRVAIFAITSTCCLLAATAYSQQIQVNKDNRTLAITASASASALADTATVHIGFVTYAPDAQAAYAKGSDISNAIAKALTSAGVAKTEIESESQGVNETPQYELEKEPAKRKFQVRQSWTVKTKADDAARVLNTAVNAGANQSGQIDWSVADENALEAQAAGKALARARAIAAQMAEGLGIKLGDLIYASNQNAGASIPLASVMKFSPGMASEKARAPLAINAQKIERSATVYAVFSIQ